MQPYPLLLTPPVKDYIWGGTRLKTEYGYTTEAAIAAEAWVLSCHKDGSSIVENGVLAGKSLPQALEEFGTVSTGSRAESFPYFPLLIKLIDARDRLSVQVHPADDYALKVEGEYGKTEMWYVVDCEPGAQLIYGFNQTLTQEQLRAHIETDTLPEVCNFVDVHAGDVFFIEAGTLHAIGAGILIAEVQQNSNTTYRVSDYGRLGADGNPRPLHVDKAVDVTIATPPTQPYGKIGNAVPVEGGEKLPLATCPMFTAELLRLNGTTSLMEEHSFLSLLMLSGEGALSWDGGEISLHKGSSVFVPAELAVTLSGEAEVLMSRC